MEKKRTRSLLANAVLFAVGFIIIGVMVYFIGAEKVIGKMLEADPYLIVLALGLMFCVLSIKLARWWILLHDANFLNASRVFLIGSATNLFAPIGTGEVMRAAVAKTKLGIRARDTMAAVVIERISDITFLVAVTGIGVVLFVPGRENFIFIMILAAILAVAFVLLVKPQLFDRLALFIERVFEQRGKFLSRLSAKISVSMAKFKEAILQFHERKAVLGGNIVLTVGSWMLEAVVTYVLLLAFDVDPPFILFILVINATSWVVRTFLFLPVGPKEVTFTFLLGVISDGAIDTGVASAVALIMLAMNYIILGSGAFVSAITFAGTRPKEEEPEEENNAEGEQAKLDEETVSSEKKGEKTEKEREEAPPDPK